MSDLYLPHTALWRKLGPRPRSLTGVDGGDLSAGTEVAAFFDPLTARQAETRYGVVGVERPHLAMFDPAVVTDLREDDVMEWDGMELIVKAVKRFDFDEPTVEAVVAARTRGRA
ncbi:MAG: hypothetical protein ACO1SV_27645 [Fimbriimonas sp.]